MNITKEEWKQASIGVLVFALSLIPPVIFLFVFTQVAAHTFDARIATAALTIVIWMFSYYHMLKYSDEKGILKLNVRW